MANCLNMFSGVPGFARRAILGVKPPPRACSLGHKVTVPSRQESGASPHAVKDRALACKLSSSGAIERIANAQMSHEPRFSLARLVGREVFQGAT